MNPPFENRQALHAFHDFEPADKDDFRTDVLAGLGRAQKQLPCKYFYDEAGSKLFDQICQLPEYYPTRTELKLLADKAAEIGDLIPEDAVFIEFGSGSSVKIRIVLDALHNPAAYVPVDISREHLEQSARTLAADYPQVAVMPVCADFTERFELPAGTPAGPLNGPRVGFFPGSTIGNFDPAAALDFLTWKADLLGPGGGLLIGVDLKKDASILNAAYNDGAGVTAAFNLNLLRRINAELGGDFDLEAFAHHAFYNAAAGRIEMHLVSNKLQAVHVDGKRFSFEKGETIHTENSYKYSIAEFHNLAAQAGFQAVHTWTDADDLFSLHYLVVG